MNSSDNAPLIAKKRINGENSDSSVKDFCCELLIEMRKDRDLLNDIMSDIQKQVSVIPSLERDIREIRSEMLGVANRVSKAEAHISQTTKANGEVDKRLRQIETAEAIARQCSSDVNKHIYEIRNMYGCVTNRVNVLELMARGINMRPPPIPSSSTNLDQQTRVENELPDYLQRSSPSPMASDNITTSPTSPIASCQPEIPSADNRQIIDDLIHSATDTYMQMTRRSQ